MTILVRFVWASLAAVLALSFASPARSAQDDVKKVGELALQLPANVDLKISPASVSLMLDVANRRAFQLLRAVDGKTIGRIYDLESRRLLVERVLPLAAFPGGPQAPSIGGQEWVHAIDPDTGVLYIAFAEAIGVFGGVTVLDGRTLDVKAIIRREPVKIRPEDIGCTSGSCLPQTPTGLPNLRGMSVVHPDLTGNPTKLLLLMEEGNLPSVDRNFNLPWIAQWDVATGRQDWIYRPSSCGNARIPAGSYAYPVFQARLGAGIYVACAAGGGTGQVVRISLDGNGRPAAEQSYPGPLNMTDAIADMEADRLLLKVSNEEGDSWWVFDGASGSYTGIVGATIAPAVTSAGLDPTSGRLYVQAPPTTKGEQSNPGGLLMSDVRRSPAPQVLAFEHLAGAGIGAVRADVHPETGRRLVYVLRKGAEAYDVYEDRVPIGADPSVDDQDKLTVDVDEKPGVTGRNFTASGHGYGARALFVGGLEGYPPTGPDSGGVRIGRHVPSMVGSPCAPGDREFVIGAVKNASLSNNLSSAAAAVAESDPGSKTDLGEPTARCYPRPTDPRGVDLWTQAIDVVRSVDGGLADRLKQYPRPLDAELDDEDTGDETEPKTDADEITGSDWPFGVVECAGDGETSTHTRVRPLDRGDEQTGPLSDEMRDTTVELERANATVSCKQTKSVVNARAQLAVADSPALLAENVPGIGTIRVGEVSSSTGLFLDPKRGLVARSVATAREISIGDEIFIDKAFTIGEAWAAGRPGTASAEFTRRLCGVRIADPAADTDVYRPSIEVDQRDPTKSKVDPEGGGKVDKSPDLQACGDPEQPALGQQPAIDAINRVLGSRGRASAPRPDGELSQGTPGGYLASVQKDRLEQISSRSVNNDPSSQVPALEIVIFNDDPTEGRGRQIYQLAGVDASVTYGIYLLNPEEPTFDDGIQDELIDFTGGVPAPPPSVLTPPPPAVQRPVGSAGPLTVLFQGIGLLFRSPKDALLAASIWALLFAPVQLTLRRRALKGLA